jgi:hypothetical protein
MSSLRSQPIPVPGMCPLCGQPNECRVADTASPCWCMSTTISREVLNSVPSEARKKVCICRTCATAGDSVMTRHS